MTTYGTFGSRAAVDRAPGTDGFAIAAIVTCLMGLVPIVLGFVSLNRIKKSGQGGKALAYTSIGLGFVSGLVGMSLFLAMLAYLDTLAG